MVVAAAATGMGRRQGKATATARAEVEAVAKVRRRATTIDLQFEKHLVIVGLTVIVGIDQGTAGERRRNFRIIGGVKRRFVLQF